jgi:hypothetical protein
LLEILSLQRLTVPTAPNLPVRICLWRNSSPLPNLRRPIILSNELTKLKGFQCVFS